MASLQRNTLNTRFKCLVDMNECKYSVIIDNNNGITVKEVINHIKQIVDKNISLKTHTFEIFDKHINDYVIITSDKQIIANLSRIRVSLSNKNNDKTSDKTVQKIKDTKMETKTKLNINKTNKKRQNSMNSNSIISNTSAESVENEKIRRDFYLIQTVYSFIDNFINDSINAWKLVSIKMSTFGYKKLSDDDCKQLFNNLISRYVEVLEISSSFQNACRRYQSFAKLNNLDLKPFLSSKTYEKVIKLKEKIALKVEANGCKRKTSVVPQKQDLKLEKPNGKRLEVIESRNKTRTEAKMGPKEVQNSFSAQRREKAVKNTDNKSLERKNIKFKLKDNNIKITFNNDNKSVRTQRKVEYKLNKSSGSQQSPQNDDLITSAIQKSSNEDLRSGSAEENTCNTSKTMTKLEKSKIRNEVFVDNTTSDLELAEKVFDLSKYFITRELFIADASTAWQMVSFEMVFKCHYEHFTASVCENRFNQLIKRYVQVLQTSTDRKMAEEQFYAFHIINKIDLSLFTDSIIYQLILDLKRKLCFNRDVSNSKSEVPSVVPKLDFKRNKNGLITHQYFKPKEPVVRKENNTKNYNFMNRQQLSGADKELLELVKTQKIDHNCIRDEVLSASNPEEQIKRFRSEVLLSKKDYEKRNKLKNKLEDILQSNHFKCVLHFFGSTDNSVGFRDSDIDLFFEFNELNNKVKKIDYKTAMNYLTRMKNALKNYFKFFIPKPIESLRCPLIKLDFRNMCHKYGYNKQLFEEIETNGITCDMSLTNALGVHNSRLIRLFCEVEPRFQDLAIILRFWAKSNEFIGSTAMSSYAFTQLIIFFCQNLSPPLLPTVDYLRQLTKKSLVVNDWECSFCDNKTLIKKSDNKLTVFQLLPQFFKFYSNFEFTTQVIRPKTGFSQHKYVYNSQNKTSFNDKNRKVFELNFKMTTLCCIEDPFNLQHNLTANLSFSVFDRFTEYIKQIAFKTDIIFNNNQRNNDWGISKIITKFDPTNGYPITLKPIGISSLNLVLKSASICTEFIIKTMVNEFSDMTLILLENVYEIDSQLSGKWDVIIEEISPFVEYTLRLKGIDVEVIDYNNREVAKSELKKEAKDMTLFDAEKAITEKVIQNFKNKKFNQFSIECRFVLFINARITCPFIDLEVIECKPASKGVNTFLNRLLELTPKVIDENYRK